MSYADHIRRADCPPLTHCTDAGRPAIAYTLYVDPDVAIGGVYGAVSLPAGVEPVATDPIASTWWASALGAAGGATLGVMATETTRSPAVTLLGAAIGAACGAAAVAAVMIGLARRNGVAMASSLDKGTP